LTAGDKNFSDFPDNQPTKFHALSAVGPIHAGKSGHSAFCTKLVGLHR